MQVFTCLAVPSVPDKGMSDQSPEATEYVCDVVSSMQTDTQSARQTGRQTVRPVDDMGGLQYCKFIHTVLLQT